MMHRETIDWYGKPLTIETGRIAKQAHGAALVTLGETTVLVTVVAAPIAKEGQDFLPLTVEYMERTYSAGKIPGGYFKREGRPTELEVLTSRLMDRPIRPLFPKGYKFETQIVAMVLSSDRENDPGVASMIGASCALTFSNIPFQGPIVGMRIGRMGSEFVVNPTFTQRDTCDLDIIVAVGPDGIAMVEGQAKFASESMVVDALMFAQEAAIPVMELQKKIAAALNITKRQVPPPPHDEALIAKVRELAWAPMCEALGQKEKFARRDGVIAVHASVKAALAEQYAGRDKEIAHAIEKLEAERLRGLILNDHVRIDGRGMTDIRPITCEIGVLPRTHGSALFTRGETQVIVAATLGTSDDEQRLDLLTGDTTRSFMLHYNFPPFSVGEVKRMGSPSRRDIGHGHLAERGVAKILPTKDDGFPYTIRIVSEVTESNGSSSMATVCGSSLALMDGGVPTKSHVGGIAMGLVKEGEKFAVLTDILGDEDHLGDMDFKVVGTTEGITSIQMDIKCQGLNRAIMTQALDQARDARIFIIGKLAECIAKPRENYSQYAPRIYTMKINTERIRDLIGPGGKHIRGICSSTGASVNVEDDGTVTIATSDQAAADKAIAMVRELTDEAEIGRIYLGQVVKIAEFGAFVKILPNVDGLVHISELSDRRVNRVEDVVQEGDEILVKVINIDNRSGKIRLSRREAMAERKAAEGGEGGGELGDRGSASTEDAPTDR